MLTDNIVTIASTLEAALIAANTTLNFQDIFYGDQERLPRNPAICIETGEKSRNLVGVPRRVEATINVYFLIYHNPLSDTQVTRKDNDTLAEQVQAVLEANEDLGGIIIHGFVTSLEPGYQMKSGTMYRATRLTYQAVTRVQLPYSAI